MAQKRPVVLRGMSPGEVANTSRLRNDPTTYTQGLKLVGGKVVRTDQPATTAPAPAAGPGGGTASNGLALSGDVPVSIDLGATGTTGNSGNSLAASPSDHQHELTGILKASHGGTGIDTSAAAIGASLYTSALGTWSTLAGNTTTTRKFYRQVGDGTSSAAPAWDTLQAADLPAVSTSTQGAAPQLPNDATKFFNGVGVYTNPLAGGLSVTITTAALTTGGTQGSMTFTDGLLTAQTAAT